MDEQYRDYIDALVHSTENRPLSAFEKARWAILRSYEGVMARGRVNPTACAAMLRIEANRVAAFWAHKHPAEWTNKEPIETRTDMGQFFRAIRESQVPGSERKAAEKFLQWPHADRKRAELLAEILVCDPELPESCKTVEDCIEQASILLNEPR